MQKNLSAATSAVFISFDGLNVEEVSELRGKLSINGTSMRVIPKKLLQIVIQKAKTDFTPEEHDGQLAVIWGPDATAPAKVIYDFAKEHEDKIRLLAGILDSQSLNLEKVISLAKLPDKQTLLGQLVGVLSSPARGLALVLSGVQHNTVYVLQAIAETKS